MVRGFEQRCPETVCFPHDRGDGPVYEGTELKLKYTAGGLNIQAYIERDKVCTLITPAQPAVYDCTPILSQAEEAQLGITEPESIDNIPF